MSIGLLDIRKGTALPGLLTTTVINFSRRGACLILPTLSLNGRHVFFETLNSDRFNLLLHPGKQEGDNIVSTIAARSIWMDSCEHMQQAAFKMGIQFLHDQNFLYKHLKKGTGRKDQAPRSSP